MMESMRKMCESLSNEERKNMMEMMKNMPMMNDMFKTMCGFDGTSTSNKTDVPLELKLLFDEWFRQITEELKAYMLKNKNAKISDIADYLKLSEECVKYLINATKAENEKKSAYESNEYETIKIPKTKNTCSLCGDYIDNNKSKPIVIASCEGACLRGEISRKAANLLCHTIIPDKTARLCLGSAITKQQNGQRQLLDNNKRLVVLEGCPVDCASRMIAGIPGEFNCEVIRTDVLADFDKKLFGINELSEDEINQQAMTVASKIAEKLDGNGGSCCCSSDSCCGG